MDRYPLLTHATAQHTVAWLGDRAVSRAQFLSDVRQLVDELPSGAHMLNMCSDRYRFSVALAAAILAGKISLLPSTHTPEVIRQMQAFAPDVFCITDNDRCDIALPLHQFPTYFPQASNEISVPEIPASQRIAVVFTSGSTGVPQPHAKTWGALVMSVRAEAARLVWASAGSQSYLLGTVPPQHMYGFESTVLMAWQSGSALSHAQPFYPADICAALASLPTPRVLITSPVHLRALLDAELHIPELAGVLSATAPLDRELAQKLESRCNAPLIEIYGSTETGLIATRRTVHTPQWQLLPGIYWTVHGDQLLACGGHIETCIAMSDKIEPLDESHFLLHGRISDMINIAGKRHSLAGLNHLLTTLPGVVDGAFFMPEDSSAQVVRLAAAVVAPSLDTTSLLAALRQHLDPVFLPRPLLFVNALPRNATGKLPRAALQALFNQSHANKHA